MGVGDERARGRLTSNDNLRPYAHQLPTACETSPASPQLETPPARPLSPTPASAQARDSARACAGRSRTGARVARADWVLADQVGLISTLDTQSGALAPDS